VVNCRFKGGKGREIKAVNWETIPHINKLCGMPPQYAPVPCELTFDLLTLKVVSDVMWATSVPILVFLGLSVLDLGPMYATDRQTDIQTDVRRQTRIIA